MRPAYHGRTHGPDGTDPITGFVDSIDGTGGPLTGDITLSAGAGIVLTQLLQNIEIAAGAASLDFFVAYQPHVVSGSGGGVRGNPDWEGVSVGGVASVVFGTLSPTIGGSSGLAIRNATPALYLPAGATWLIVFGNNPLGSPPSGGSNIPRIYAGANPDANPVYRIAQLSATDVNHKSFAASVAHFPATARGIESYVGNYSGSFGAQTPTTFNDEANMGCTLLVVRLAAA